MKKILFTITTCMILLTSLTYGAFSPSIPLDTSTQINYQDVIDNFFDVYVKKHENTAIISKFTHAQTKVDTILDDTRLTDEYRFILEYIAYWMDIYVSEHIEETTETSPIQETDETSTEEQEDVWTTDTIDISSYQAGNKILTAGEISGPVIKFEIIAQYEDIILENYSLIWSHDMFGDSIDTVYIYDDQWRLLTSNTALASKATFSKDIILERGQNDLYIVLEPYTVGHSNFNDAPVWTMFTLTFQIDEAKGATSSQNIPTTQYTNTQDTISIASVNVWGIQFLDQYQGYRVDTHLYNQSKADLAIISISIDAGNNTSTVDGSDLETILEELTLTLRDNTAAGNISSTLQIQRIDTWSEKISLDRTQGDLIIFDMTDLPKSKNTIDTNDTAVFLITWIPTLTPSVSESITLEANHADTDYGVLTYRTSDPTSPISGTKFGSQTYLWEHTLYD